MEEPSSEHHRGHNGDRDSTDLDEGDDESDYEVNFVIDDQNNKDEEIENYSLPIVVRQSDDGGGETADENDQFAFDLNKFSGELIQEKTRGNVCIKLYRNNDHVPNLSNFYNIPIIFCGDYDVYYCKKHCEQVFSMPNMHTSLNRAGVSKCLTLKGHILTMYKEIMASAQQSNTEMNLKLDFSPYSHRISFVSGSDLSNCLKNKVTQTELSSFYLHKYILLINGVELRSL